MKLISNQENGNEEVSAHWGCSSGWPCQKEAPGSWSLIWVQAWVWHIFEFWVFIIHFHLKANIYSVWQTLRQYRLYLNVLLSVLLGLSSFSNMFGKKKKRLEISAPSNFEHRVHTGFDPREQKFTGLPQQWQSLLADTANRPKPMVDPSYITPIQLAPMKVHNSPSALRVCVFLFIYMCKSSLEDIRVSVCT